MSRVNEFTQSFRILAVLGIAFGSIVWHSFAEGCQDFVNLEAWFSFDEGQGDSLRDYSGNNQNVLVPAGLSWVTGHRGSALKFDGTYENSLTWQSSLISMPTEITAILWTTIPMGQGYEPYFFGTANGGEWGMRILSGQVASYVGTECGVHYVFGPKPEDTLWHQIAFTWKQQTGISLFLDGDSIAFLAVPDCPIRSYSPLPILGPYLGAADEFAIWSRCFSSAEIRQSHNRYRYCGDPDASGVITISDVVFLINYIFAGGPAPNPLISGEVDCDAIVTISDAVYLVSYIFAGGSPPCGS